MKYIIWIGMYDKYGVFHSDNWNPFINWIRDKCDKIEIYANFSRAYVYEQFGEKNIINEYVFEDTGYSSYDIVCANIVTGNFTLHFQMSRL